VATGRALKVTVGTDAPARAASLLARRIEAVAGPPARALRSPEALVAGGLVVAVLPAVLPKLLELLNGWVSTRKGRTVRVKVSRGSRSVEVEFAPGGDAEERILAFVDRLEARLGAGGPKARRK
jgi:hypothetical protein